MGFILPSVAIPGKPQTQLKCETGTPKPLTSKEQLDADIPPVGKTPSVAAARSRSQRLLLPPVCPARRLNAEPLHPARWVQGLAPKLWQALCLGLRESAKEPCRDRSP